MQWNILGALRAPMLFLLKKKVFKKKFVLLFLNFSANYPRFVAMFSIYSIVKIMSFTKMISILLKLQNEYEALKKVNDFDFYHFWYYDQYQDVYFLELVNIIYYNYM